MLEWLTNTEYAEWVRESWGWPLALTIHAFGTATVVGLIMIIGLRLFGLFRTIPYTSLSSFFPIIWIAIAFQFISGFTLWMTKPSAISWPRACSTVKDQLRHHRHHHHDLFPGDDQARGPRLGEGRHRLVSRGIKFVSAAASVLVHGLRSASPGA